MRKLFLISFYWSGTEYFCRAEMYEEADRPFIWVIADGPIRLLLNGNNIFTINGEDKVVWLGNKHNDNKIIDLTSGIANAIDAFLHASPVG